MKIVICDDNQAVCKELKSYIHNNFNFDATCCTNTKDLLNIVKTQHSEIKAIILDIVLENNSNGIEIAANIHKQYSDIKIIFITGYDDIYYKNIFSYFQPFGFLSKPIQYNTLHFFLRKIEINNTQKKYFKITSNYKEKIIPFNDIIYIQSVKRVCEINTIDCQHKSYTKISNLEKETPQTFIRCHQSFIVNSKFIKKLVNNQILLKNGITIPISRKYISKINKLLADKI